MSEWQPIADAPRDGTRFIVGHFVRIVDGEWQQQMADGSWEPFDGNPHHFHPAPIINSVEG